MRNKTTDKKKLLERFSKTPIVEAACKQAGIPRSTYYRWRKLDSKFAQTCDEVIEQSAGIVTDMAESQLISAIKDRNMTAIIFWLKHHHKAYKTKVEVDATIRAAKEELSPEQASLVSQALQLSGLISEGDEDESEPAK